MIRLLRAELRKLLTTKLWWGMLLGAVGFAALGVVGQIASNGSPGNPTPPLSSPVTQRSIMSSASSGYLFSIIVGIILMTTEFRHFTSRPTFLIEPRRGRVIISKLVLAAGVGVVYGIACAAVTLAIAVPWLGAKHVSIDLGSNDLLPVLVRAVVVIAIYAVVGIGVGVLVRNQISAVIGAMAYLLVFETLIAIIPVVKQVYKFLPGATAQALIGVGARAGRGAPELLDPLQGGLLLLAWGLALTVVSSEKPVVSGSVKRRVQ
jgi:ABC-2 type transport system permease protein